jgi:hypothetical protein
MKLEPLTPSDVPALTQRLPEPAVEVAFAYRLNVAPSSSGKARTSNVQDAGSNPAGAANTYVDDASGASVTDDWWPGDPRS